MKVFRPIPILRVEGAIVFLAALVAYGRSGGGWGWFLACFFAPDVSILAYLCGSRAGWAAYNAVHSYLGPVLLGYLAQDRGGGLLWTAALIWGAHVSWDRLCGFGLKEGEDFWITHLGAIRAGKALWEKLAGK